MLSRQAAIYITSSANDFGRTPNLFIFKEGGVCNGNQENQIKTYSKPDGGNGFKSSGDVFPPTGGRLTNELISDLSFEQLLSQFPT